MAFERAEIREAVERTLDRVLTAYNHPMDIEIHEELVDELVNDLAELDGGWDYSSRHWAAGN